MISRHRLTLLLPAFLALASLLAWAVGSVGRSSPELEPIARLASTGQFDAAGSALDKILAAYPDLADGHLLAAQLLLDRPEPQTGPGERPASPPATAALDHLARVGPGDPRRSALVDLYQGKAKYRLAQLDAAEADWLAALRLDPSVPEAGWCLLEMYYLEGRTADSRALALRLHQAEPDPRDRVQFLLELLRQDAQPIAPESVVQWFEPAARQAPGDLHVGLTLGLALIRIGQSERGLALLAQITHDHPAEVDAWDAWLAGLDVAGDIERMEEAHKQLPSTLDAEPRFARYRARLAQEEGNIPAAIAAYRRALEWAPGDQALEYRLTRVLRLAGDLAGAERIEQDRQAFLEAGRGVRSLYEEANAIPNLGPVARPDLYRRIADLRERLGQPAEARAWYRLILRDQPGDPPSVAAIERLGQ